MGRPYNSRRTVRCELCQHFHTERLGEMGKCTKDKPDSPRWFSPQSPRQCPFALYKYIGKAQEKALRNEYVRKAKRSEYARRAHAARRAKEALRRQQEQQDEPR